MRFFNKNFDNVLEKFITYVREESLKSSELSGFNIVAVKPENINSSTLIIEDFGFSEVTDGVIREYSIRIHYIAKDLSHYQNARAIERLDKIVNSCTGVSMLYADIESISYSNNFENEERQALINVNLTVRAV